MTAAVTNLDVVVYRARNLVNGKCYVGVTKCGLAWREGMHRKLARRGGGYRLHAALRKYGDANIVFEKVADFGADLPSAFAYEADLIDAEKPAYNTSRGGWLGAEALEKLLAGKLQAHVKRWKMTKEQRERHAEAMRKGWKTRTVRRHSPDTIARISAAKMGAPGFWTGKKRPATALMFSKPIRCIDDGKVFGSAKEAEEFYGLAKDRAAAVARDVNKTARGWRFEYVVKH